jgi:hypothetical protein
MGYPGCNVADEDDDDESVMGMGEKEAEGEELCMGDCWSWLCCCCRPGHPPCIMGIKCVEIDEGNVKCS